MNTTPHPNQAYESLLALAKHPVKKRNLEALHRTCREQHEAGQRAFTYAGIGRLLEAGAVMTQRALNNPQSKDYRTLIDAWAAYTRSKAPKAANIDDRSWLMKIPDPAVRQLVQLQEAELNKMRGEVQSLRKLQQPITLYTGTAAPQEKGQQDVIMSASLLTPTERASLSQAFDANYLSSKGLAVGDRGRIMSADGRVIFERGFVDGLRKLIGAKS